MKPGLAGVDADGVLSELAKAGKAKKLDNINTQESIFLKITIYCITPFVME